MEFWTFAAYLDAYWRNCAEPAGLVSLRVRRARPIAVRRILGGLKGITQDVHNSNRSRAGVEYYPARRLLSIRRPALTRLAGDVGKKSYATNFAEEDQPFVRDTTAFARSAAFDELRRSGYADLVRTIPGLDPRDCGAVIVGREKSGRKDDILWIGITPLHEIALRRYEERPALLRTPILPLLPTGALPPWLLSPAIQSAIERATNVFLERAAAKYRAGEITDAVGTPLNAPSDEVVWTAERAEDLDLLAALESASARRATRLVVLTSRSIEDVRTTVVATGDHTQTSVEVLVADRNLVSTWLARAPWDWVDLWRAVPGIRVFRGSDPVGLRLLRMARSDEATAAAVRGALTSAVTAYETSSKRWHESRVLQRAVFRALRDAGVSSWRREGERFIGLVAREYFRFPARQSPGRLEWPLFMDFVRTQWNASPTERKVSAWEVDPLESFLASLTVAVCDIDHAASQLTGDVRVGTHLLLVGQAGSGKSMLAAQLIADSFRDAIVLLITNPEAADRDVLAGIIAPGVTDREVLILIDRCELNPAATRSLCDFLLQLPHAFRSVLILLSRDVALQRPTQDFQRVVLPRTLDAWFATQVVRDVADEYGVALTGSTAAILGCFVERFRLTPQDVHHAGSQGRLSAPGLRAAASTREDAGQLSDVARCVLRIIGFLRGVGVRRLRVGVIWSLARETLGPGEFHRALEELVESGWVAFPVHETGEVYAPAPTFDDPPTFEAGDSVTQWEWFARFVLRSCDEEAAVPKSVRRRILMARSTWLSYFAESFVPLYSPAERSLIAASAARYASRYSRIFGMILGELARWDIDACVARIESLPEGYTRASYAVKAFHWFHSSDDWVRASGARLAMAVLDALLPSAPDWLLWHESWRSCIDAVREADGSEWGDVFEADHKPIELWSTLASLMDACAGEVPLQELRCRLLASEGGRIILALLVCAPISMEVRKTLATGVAVESLPDEFREDFSIAIAELLQSPARE